MKPKTAVLRMYPGLTRVDRDKLSKAVSALRAVLERARQDHFIDVIEKAIAAVELVLWTDCLINGLPLEEKVEGLVRNWRESDRESSTTPYEWELEASLWKLLSELMESGI